MSTTTNLALNEPAYNSTSPTWDQPLNYNSTILDQMFGSTTGVSVNTGGTTTYTNITAPSPTAAGSTSQCMRFNLTGALAANQYVLLPQNVAGMWIVTNSTSGAFSVYVGSNNGSNAAAGTTVIPPQGYSTVLYSDGTNVKLSNDGLLAGGVVTSFSAGSTGLTPNSSTTGAVSLAGTLAVANGGTGLTTTPTNGTLDIGNGTGFTRTTLTAGSNVSITNGAGSITISSNVNSQQLASAWVSFNGGNGTINRSYNVSSVNRTNTGSYTVNFTTALPASSYATAGVTSDALTFNSGSKTTTSYSFTTKNSSNFSLQDAGDVSVIIFGN